MKVSRRKNHTYENIIEIYVCILERPKIRLCGDMVDFVKFPQTIRKEWPWKVHNFSIFRLQISK